VPEEGIFARVVHGGCVKTEDHIRIRKDGE